MGQVLYGLVASLLFGFAIGWLVCKVVTLICAGMDRRRTNGFFTYAQIVGAAAMSFMHGAQDGQKFMSIFVLAITLAGVGQPINDPAIWLMFFCALNMGLGTAVGGERIIKKRRPGYGEARAVPRIRRQRGNVFLPYALHLCRLAVSTTHTNTTAIMGVGAAKRKSAVKWGIAIDMVKTWVLTFPGCGLLGFAFAHLFLMFS